LKITVKVLGVRGQDNNSKQDRGFVHLKRRRKLVRSVMTTTLAGKSIAPTGQTDPVVKSRQKMLKLRNPEVDKLKVIKTKVKDKNENFKPIFDSLLSKYVN
jgi:hypothetical protein